MLAAIMEADADTISTALSCFKNNKVAFIRDYDKSAQGFFGLIMNLLKLQIRNLTTSCCVKIFFLVFVSTKHVSVMFF